MVRKTFAADWRSYRACSRTFNPKSFYMLHLIHQPMMRLAYMPTSNTTYSQPFQTKTQVKSNTHSSLRRCALKCRVTLSIGHSAYASDVAVASTS